MIALFRSSSLVTLALLLPAPSLAACAAENEPAYARNPAAAQAPFEEARLLVGAGDYEQACPRFKASYALDHGATVSWEGHF